MPNPKRKERLINLFENAPEQRKHITPIPKLAQDMRRNEPDISFKLKSPIFFLRDRSNIKKVTTPDMEVANAIPPILRGNIRMEFKTMFMARLKADILAGVRVSLRLKKQACSILFAP